MKEPDDALSHKEQLLGSEDGIPLPLPLQAGSVDIQGVCKSTVVRGEDDFPVGVLRVTDCHDTVVYALAPLQYVKIAACSDCQVIPGAAADER